MGVRLELLYLPECQAEKLGRERQTRRTREAGTEKEQSLW
jgi:hypothetical protein